MAQDQPDLIGSGLTIILKSGLKHEGQLVHIDTATSSISLRSGVHHPQWQASLPEPWLQC